MTFCAVAAAEQSLERLLDFLGFEILADLLDGLDDLLLALHAEVGLVPRALDAHRDLEFDRLITAPSVRGIARRRSSGARCSRVCALGRSMVPCAGDAHARAHQPQVLVVRRRRWQW